MADASRPGSVEGPPSGWEDSPARIALIRAQLDKILASSGFVNSTRMRKFLRFVVDGTLAGRRDDLKESIIGTAVFDRASGYDPSVEPVVRVEARRLREKLQEYYEGEGLHDAVVIGLPKGGYTPSLEFRPVEPDAGSSVRCVKTKPSGDLLYAQIAPSTSAALPVRSHHRL